MYMCLLQDFLKNFNWPKPNQGEEGKTEAKVEGIIEAAVVAF